MAIARLPVILVIVLYLQDIVQGQQLNILPGKGSSNAVLNLGVTDQRVADLISNAQNNQNKCGNSGSSMNIQQNTNKLTGLHQFLSLQQPTNPVNLQPQTLNVQPTLGNQNVQQALNLQQPLNVQQCTTQNLQQPLNLQPANVQQPVNQQQCLNLQQVPIDISQQISSQQPQLKQPVSLQQLLLQQNPRLTVPINNLQLLNQQAPSQAEHCLPSLPVINGQIQGLPSQVSQGVLLSNLGLSSNLPSLLSNSCSKPTADQLTLIIPQNNVASLQNVPASVYCGAQTANAMPITVSSSYLPSECAQNNANLDGSLSFVVPVGAQNAVANQQNQALGSALNQIAAVPNVQYQPYPNQVTLQNVQTQSVPVQTDPTQCVQSQRVPTQPTQSKCIQSIPIQTAPVQNVPNQAPSTIQSQPNQISVPNQQSLTSLLLSQMLPSNGSPSPYSNLGPYPANSNPGSKSSSMKALLPLLFNLLKEKNGGCGCPNCNCGFMNNMQDYGNRIPYNMPNNNFNPQTRNTVILNSENNNDGDECQNKIVDNNSKKNDAEVFDGYSKQKKYGQGKDKESIINSVRSDEMPRKAQEKKFENSKKIKNESIEEYDNDDEYADSYENDD